MPNSKSSKKKRSRLDSKGSKHLKDLSLLYESDDEEFNLKTIKINPFESAECDIAPKATAKGKESKRQAKSEPKTKKGKGKAKPKKDYMKGKYNIKITPLSKSIFSDSKDSNLFDKCCVTCTNRNVIRAAKTGNIELLKKCIEARSSISTLFEPWSKGNEWTAVEYAVINNDRPMLALLFNYLLSRRKPRVIKEANRINLTDSGENSEFMVGVRVRKLNTTRGNKMGNNAFIFDDVSGSDNNTNMIGKKVVQIILEKGKDPTLIDYINSLVVVPTIQTSNYDGTFGRSSNIYFDFQSNIYMAVRAGNKVMAGYLIKKLNEFNNFGFHALHSDVLNAKSAEDLQIKVKTSLTKKSITNFNITPVHVACINPDARYIEKMVNLGSDWNCLEAINRKPIHYAAACEGEGPLNYLISIGALVDEGDKFKVTPLMIACEFNRIDNAIILIKKGANILLKNKQNFNNAFHIACEKGYVELAKRLLEETNLPIDVPGKDRMTALNLAAFRGHYEMVEFLVENGAKVTKKDKFRRSPLINAIRGGHAKIVSYLLSKGSEYDFPDSSKNTPIHYACAYGWSEIVELLIQAGANPSLENDWKISPLEIAFLKNHFCIVKYLLDHSLCDVNTKFNLDMRLLHYCFMKITPKSLEEMRYFIIEKKANVNLQNFYGESILHLLAKFNFQQYKMNNPDNRDEKKELSMEEMNLIQKDRHRDLIKKIFTMIQQNNVLDIDQITQKGKTPLQIAMENKNIPFLEEIMKFNPKYNFQDTTGNTILHLAVPMIFGDEDDRIIIEMLFDKLEKIPIDDCETLANASDEKGFTPFLKLMYEYKQRINGKYIELFEKEKKKLKTEKLDKKENQSISKKDKTKLKSKKKPLKSKSLHEDDEEAEEEDNFEEEQEEEDNEEELKNSFIQGRNNFGMSWNQPEDREQKIMNVTLSKEEIESVEISAKLKFQEFLENYLIIIKKFIKLKSNPHIRVGKLAIYRISPTNPNNKPEKPKEPLLKHSKVENQYFEKNGKQTAFMYLMQYPYETIVSYFIDELKVNVNEINLYKENAVFSLINSIPSIYSIDNNYSLPLRVLETLLMKQINIRQLDWKGNTTFLLMSKVFNVELMQLLSMNGADVNLCNKMEENALIYYVRKKDTEKVKILINQFNLDINYQNNKKRTCMHYLLNDETESTNMDESLSDFLLSCHPNLKIKDILGRTPIHYLFIKINSEFTTSSIDPISSLSKLLEFGEVDLEASDIYGNTPLHYAAQRGSTISLLTLFTQKIDINKKNNEGNSPLAYALMFNQPNAAILFIQQGAVIDTYARMLDRRNEKELIKEMLQKLKEKEKIANLSSSIQMTTGLGTSMTTKLMDLSSNFDLNSSIGDASQLNVSSVGQGIPVQKAGQVNSKPIQEEKDEEMEIEQEEEEKSAHNESESEDEESSYEECSDDDSQKSNNRNNPNNFNQFGGFGNNYGAMGMGPSFGRKIIKPYVKYPYNTQGGWNNTDKEEKNEVDSYNNKYFITKIEKEEGVKLFRICIKNEFQGITFLFLSKGYPMMKAIEDSFYEKKFNLSKKLLAKSPRIDIYTALNEHKQNLFHILGKIGRESNELEEFFNILYSKKISLTACDMEGNTPLHYAASNHFTKLVKFICDKEKDNKILSIQNNYYCTPFMNGIKGSLISSFSTDLLNLLFTEDKRSVEYEENYYEDNYKLTPILHVVRYILQNHLPLKVTNEGLFDAKKQELNYMNVLYKLLESGASVMERDSYGKDALMYCVIENNIELLKILISKTKKSNIIKNAVDREGKSLVSYCVAVNDFGSYENEEMLKYLLENKFDSTIKDIYGYSPLEHAKNQKTGNNLKILKKFNVLGANLSSIPLAEDDMNEEVFDSVFPFETDAEELFILKKKEAPDEKRKKIPNLLDYQDEQFELYQDEQYGYWDASLTKVDIQNGIYGEYMFYFIQLIHDKGKGLYIVTTQFGRIGEEGANQRSPFNNIEEAKEDFKKIFKSKTGNLWENKNNFEKQKGKYMLLKFNDVQLTHKELLKPFDYNTCPESKVTNPKIKDLLKVFTESSIYFKALSDRGINTDFFNFSMLNKSLLLKAKELMKEIVASLEELNAIRNEKTNNTGFNNTFALTPEKVEKITEISNKIYKLSSRYYELIPKMKFKNRMISPFRNIDEAKQEVSVLEDLTSLERAISILLGAQYRMKELNPLDYIYNCLQTTFEVVTEQSTERAVIEKYIHNTTKEKIIDVFRVFRKGESAKCKKWSTVPNHLLLFHGTKVFNYLGIFSNGLKIAPPEAPSTGYLFGKGLYFADMFSKSINYCDNFYDKETKKNYSYILLCEVVVGKTYTSKTIPLGLEFDKSFLNEGYNSFKSTSYQGPNLNKNFITNNGITIPLGTTEDYGIRKIKINEVNNSCIITEYPEYVVYDTSQVVIRYIVKMERN